MLAANGRSTEYKHLTILPDIKGVGEVVANWKVV